MRLFQVFLFEEKTILPVVKCRPTFLPKPITGCITQYCCHYYQCREQNEVKKIVVYIKAKAFCDQFVAINTRNK